MLREHGVKVLTVREILAHGVDQHMGARVQLEALAMSTLQYQVCVCGGVPAWGLLVLLGGFLGCAGSLDTNTPLSTC